MPSPHYATPQPYSGGNSRSSRISRMPHHQLPPAASCHLRGTSPTAANTILSRRSAQRFDAGHVMPRVDFMQILESLQPSAGAPWDALAHAPHINLLLFVHRVEGLESGLYLLPRVSRLLQTLQSELDARFLRQPVDDGALQLLAAVPAAELHRLTRSLHCHQDIAANACFAVVMLAEFDAVIKADPAAYRNLFREAGLIGQALYLQAEAHGLRGTGIGCYFDDPVHELLGLKGDTFKSMYHFTVGLPLEDSRIQTITTWDALK
ncbi:hypothetical protein MTYP_00203 [Methylophilaceae bacterium]|nr:hypothetical protein MTYP_00203 [Methylophilaceae bacterium]